MNPTEVDHIGCELFFGVIAPIGTDVSTVIQELRIALEKVSYYSEEVHIIDLLHEIAKWEHLQGLGGLTKYEQHIAAGREFCETIGRNDALVALAMGRVKELRTQGHIASGIGDLEPPIRSRNAYIFRSLKRPDEVKTLRAVYGDAFWLIAASSPREARVQTLSSYLEEGAQGFDSDHHRANAERLVEIDENEAQYSQSQNHLDRRQLLEYGQDVRATFPMADVFVDTSNYRTLKYSIRRFVRILFQYQFNTPNRDEYGMANARIASLRSADLSRQVGAAVARADGTIIASGANEVPCSGGGLYWAGDDVDRRDFQLRKNVSYHLRRRVLTDVIRRLSEMEKLSPEWKVAVDENISVAVDEALESGLLRDARIMDVIEFGRTVHAEMAAITDAARNGIALAGCTLYTTTFPCHDCARHIIAAGIRRVVYIEPYPKSLATELFGDSIIVDSLGDSAAQRVHFEPFVGISPDRYNVLFRMGRRRGKGDQIATWNKKTAVPRLSGMPAYYLVAEIKEVERLAKDLRTKGLVPVDPSNDTLQEEVTDGPTRRQGMAEKGLRAEQEGI